MKKIKYIPLLALATLLSSCNFNILKVEKVSEYGNLKFKDPITIDLLMFGDQVLYNVHGDGDELKKVKGNEIGAFNDLPEYTYKFYDTSLENKGMYILEYKTYMNEKHCWLYVSKDADPIPSKYVMDFPHHDSFINGGNEVTINGKKYAGYGSTNNFSGIVKNLSFVEDGKNYYQVGSYTNWIAKVNDSSSDYFDLLYEIDATDELPVDIVVATKGE